MSLQDSAQAFVLKKLPESEVELMGEVPFEVLAPYREGALAHIAQHLQMPGFRPGHIPPEVALKKAGELAVLEEQAELFIKDFYPVLIKTHTVEAVGRPDIRVTKLAAGNPVGLVVRATVYPEVTLPKGWKGLHEKVALEPSMPASDEEVAQTLENLRQSRKKDDAVPELNDEFAKSVGAFETLEALKEQIELLLEQSMLAVPRLFVESELEKIMSQMREDVKRFGMELEEYFKKTNKTEEGARQEFRDPAMKRAKLHLVLKKIATEEKLDAEEAAVATEMKHAFEHFPEANPELLKIHIETVLRNELALKLLEGELKIEAK